MAVIRTENTDKKIKRKEKMAASERITNCFMLNLTYGLGAIILLEIVRRQYELYMSRYDESYLAFASKFCIVVGVLFALGAATVAILGALNKIKSSRLRNYTIFFVIASLASFFLSYDLRLPISTMLLSKGGNYGALNFMANLNLARDAKFMIYGVVAFIVVALVVYAVRLARLEKNGKCRNIANSSAKDQIK